MGPWSAGTTNVFLTDSAGNDGGAAGQTVYARGGPGGLVGGARGRGPGARRRDPDRGGGRRDHDGRRAGDRRPARVGRGDRGADRRRRRGPEAGPDDAPRPGGRRAGAPLAGREHPDAGDGRDGQPSRSAGCPASPPPATGPRPSGCCGAGSSSPRGSTTSSGRSTRRSTAGSSDAPYLEATIPSLVDPSLVDGREGRDAGHERPPPVRPVPPPRGELGRAPRGARRPGDPDARGVRAGDRLARHRPEGADPARPRARLRPDRRPPAPRRAGARQLLRLAAAVRPRPLPAPGRRALPRRVRAPTRAAGSPASPARTPPARSSPTASAGAASSFARGPCPGYAGPLSSTSASTPGRGSTGTRIRRPSRLSTRRAARAVTVRSSPKISR